jgi:hypothetical protein
MNTQGFYKYQDGQIFHAPTFVEGTGILLLASEKDTYQYPVDGWIWAESEDEALNYFGVSIKI